MKTVTHAIERQYSGIKVSDSIKVTVTDRVKHVTVSCDKRVLPYVILAVKNNVLNIEYEEIDIIGNPQTEILVPASAELCYIYGISSARISTEVPVAAKEVSVRGTSNAVLDITVDTRKCRVDINSGAILYTFRQSIRLPCGGCNRSRVQRGKARCGEFFVVL